MEEVISLNKITLSESFPLIRQRTLKICQPLKAEDYVVQPVVEVSPPKWHLGHTTWFFENFILSAYLENYRPFNPDFSFVFNSYYESAGAKIRKEDRGSLSRPSLDEVLEYRRYVDEAMQKLFPEDLPFEVTELIVLGLNHEEQHQELLCMDIKNILAHQPGRPPYISGPPHHEETSNQRTITFPNGIYEIGFTGNGFCFDNELARHKVYLHEFEIDLLPVTNGEFIKFIEEGGYEDYRFWHAEGIDWVRSHGIVAPLYWKKSGDKWHHYTLGGMEEVRPDEPVNHISYYEAAAFAAWMGRRLPTEEEWEVASPHISWGKRWEWTESAYLPYPGFKKREGPTGEYNGKFMVGQMVLRGASEITPPGHSRASYRNFFHPQMRWQYSGLRLANHTDDVIS